jgi:hypothetical protein
MLILSCGTAGAQSDQDIRQRIAQAAKSAAGWTSGQIHVYDEEQFRRPGCSFYTVANDGRMHTELLNFVLVGDKIIGVGDGGTVARILDTCSHDAPPAWFAEIVTRYHRDLGRGLVLRDERTKSSVVRTLAETGLTFSPPIMDKDKLGLTFLLWDPELNMVYRVHAGRPAGGPVHVEKIQLLRPLP